jgi:hypothetical protein
MSLETRPAMNPATRWGPQGHHRGHQAMAAMDHPPHQVRSSASPSLPKRGVCQATTTKRGKENSQKTTTTSSERATTKSLLQRRTLNWPRGRGTRPSELNPSELKPKSEPTVHCQSWEGGHSTAPYCGAGFHGAILERIVIHLAAAQTAAKVTSNAL